jgi:anti-sigma regulatory factor (Ser/Thr protein kinase)
MMIRQAADVASSADVAPAEEVQLFFLNAGPMACRQARRAVLADGFGSSSVRDDVALLVTELVTNAVRHGSEEPGRAVRVELRRWPAFVRVEVFNDGGGFTAEAPFNSDRANGWGLVLVDRVADRWGIAPTASGTRAWFEIRTTNTREAPSKEPTRLGRILGRASVLKNATTLPTGR